MLPAAGQGALGIELRSTDQALAAQLAGLLHRPTWLACHAERAVSRALGGSCSVPLAAHAVWQGRTLLLRAALGDAGRPLQPLLTTQLSLDLPAPAQPVAGDLADDLAAATAAATALGERAAGQLLAQGAQAYLASSSAA